MILICYDGSPDAHAAVEEAARLFSDQPATVLTVWEPFTEVIARTTVGFGLIPSIPDADEMDAASEKAAQQTAEEGVELARERGLNAAPRSCCQTTTTGRAILSTASDLDADAIVMGSRGLTGLKSLLIGSVSHDVIQHADRTVVVVPSPQVASVRASKARQEAAL